MTNYTFFWGGPFSNWMFSPFVHKGVQFASAEQAMMWEKATLFGDNEIALEILKTNEPRVQKELGRSVTGFSAEIWTSKCYDIVVEILRQKFAQNMTLRDALLNTRGTTLVEASPLDKIWGIGLTSTDPRALNEDTWNGLNLLGKALTQVRTEFENEGK